MRHGVAIADHSQTSPNLRWCQIRPDIKWLTLCEEKKYIIKILYNKQLYNSANLAARIFGTNVDQEKPCSYLLIVCCFVAPLASH